MKKLFFSFALLFLISFTSQADPAKKVVLAYSSDTLSIEAIHSVKNVDKHFIDQVIVLVNGKEFKTLTFTKQSAADAERLKLAMPDLKAGDVVEVKTRCNEFGNKSAKLEIK